jgi:hypothetical protein
MHFTKLLLPFVAVASSVHASLSVSDFQQAVSPVANAINALNRAIQANPTDTATVPTSSPINYLTRPGLTIYRPSRISNKFRIHSMPLLNTSSSSEDWLAL